MAMLVSDAGKLNRKCKFYAKEEVETKRGTIRIEEVFKFSCWCNIRQARISEIQVHKLWVNNSIPFTSNNLL